MFGPKHTIESVTKELVNGLEEGTIILQREVPTEADVETFESMMTLARFRRVAVALLTVSTLAAIVSIAIVLVQLVQLVFHPESQSQAGDPHSGWAFMLLGSIVLAVTGFLAGRRVRVRTLKEASSPPSSER